jgi:DNA-binding response OmpR family regulator
MPECDGWTVLKKLKSDSALAEIPVIMVTIVDNEAMGLDLGASNYLIKPVDRDRLAVLIEKHRTGRTASITGAPATPLITTPQQRRRESERRTSGKVDHAEDLVSRR